MCRLLVHVEGQTEETFVKDVLRPHLCGLGYHSVDARLVGNARLREGRFGIKGWDSVSKEIVGHLTTDPACFSTTMVDYYALPASGAGMWPGRSEAPSLPFGERASHVEDALGNDVVARMGDAFNPRRFVPFVVMHEFEALLFSNCGAFAAGINRIDLAPRLQSIRSQFATPEEINDSPQTAPSKRIAALVPGYQKPLYGVLGILEIGLNDIRRECPHFGQWLAKLEALPRQ